MRAPIHNVGGWPARRAALAGGDPALADPDRRLDHAGLEDRVRRLAHWLAARGAGRGDRIALLLSNRTAYVEAVFAAARIGGISVPINARLAPPEIAQLLDDCRPRVLLAEDALADVAERACAASAAAPPVRLRVGGAPDAYERALAEARPDPAIAAVAPDDPMMILYTSGTTGVPKGALLPHRKTLYNCLNAELFFDLTHADRVLVVLPLFHSFGLQILALPTLYAGGCVVLERGFDPAAVWRSVERERISFFGGVPTLFDAMLRARQGEAADADLRSLRFLFTAGAAIATETIRAYERHGLVLKQGFGQTETSILCCLDARDALRKAGSVGRAVFHVELRVVTPDSVVGPVAAWRDARPGETGEIVVRGPITMLGYWERPDATAETLRDDWLRTGDLGAMDAEGFVTLVGRARDLYISGGENVYPAQVEAVYAAHPDVREIAVIGVPDARWGEAGRAFVVPEPGARIETDALRAWGRERLAVFKLPREFRAVEALPRTASGKVQKHRLRAG